MNDFVCSISEKKPISDEMFKFKLQNIIYVQMFVAFCTKIDKDLYLPELLIKCYF